MKVGIIVGFGLGMITLLTGHASSAADAIAPLAAAPTPLVPEAYTAGVAAPAAAIASAEAHARLSPSPVAAPAVTAPTVAASAPKASTVAARAATPPVVKASTVAAGAGPTTSLEFKHYHPYWVVNGH